MSFVMVERVTDAQAAADDLARRGEAGRAEQVRERGAGVFVMSDPAELGSDRERAMRGLAMWRQTREADGLRVFLRLDYDPDWSKQNAAARAALREVPELRERSAVAAVNAFNRSYFDWSGTHDITDHGDDRWPQVAGVNFANGAYRLANALAGLRLVDPSMQPYALATAARRGWNLTSVHPTHVSAELWLAYALGRTLRQCGEGDPERLSQSILDGSEGNS